MATVFCPKINSLAEMHDCLSCSYVRSDEDASTVWCKYLIGRPMEVKRTVRDLRTVIDSRYKDMNHFYKIGKTKVAEKISREIMILERQVKEMG